MVGTSNLGTWNGHWYWYFSRKGYLWWCSILSQVGKHLLAGSNLLNSSWSSSPDINIINQTWIGISTIFWQTQRLYWGYIYPMVSFNEITMFFFRHPKDLNHFEAGFCFSPQIKECLTKTNAWKLATGPTILPNRMSFEEQNGARPHFSHGSVTVWRRFSR